MSFLSRHKSRGLHDVVNTDKNTGLTTPPREHEERLGPPGGSLRKRLSSFTLLSTSKRQNATSSHQSSLNKGGGVGFVRPNDAFPVTRSRSPSPVPSLEIRRPSGLGRRASIMLPESDEVLDISYRGRRPMGGMSRKLSVSAPDLSLPLFKWEEVSSVAEDESERLSSELGYLRPGSSRCPSPIPEPASAPRFFDFSRIPAELLKSLFTESSRRDLASLSLVCRSFVWPARAALYEHLNLQDMKAPRSIEKCMAWLASRREIAAMVKSFSCPVAPDFTPGNVFTPAAMVTFAIALTNMVQLQSLTLPRFTPHLLLHTTFQLRRFSLTCESMSPEESRDTFAWLTTQPSLVSLSFPNLVMESIQSPNGAIPFPTSTLAKAISLESVSPDIPGLPLTADAIPKLSHFHGPSSLASVLVPGRPVQTLSITIHTTLYDGLRPSALMASVKRSTSLVTSLSIIASGQKKVDARTLERVLMSAGAELGDCLQTLEIEWILEDELLYKQVVAALPRFAALRTLRLHRRLPPPPPRSPPPSLPLPTTALSTPPPSPSSFLANSKIFSWTPPDSPNPSFRLSTASKRISLDVPLPRAHERAHLVGWSKGCRSLRNVVFLSGAEWRITDGASQFLYVGIART
ncbi:hypothetical protein EIP91_000165 [Steccherinum ochraceum]|uniref:F-box domain-containing protein n=1 Tax=Steccherinum ochraceum TaxID=92696 RepID=A0A4R0RU97_9APHY|nr:hypothetical protein EIP91_000165 [Steccherinum ochraceum]